MAEAGQKGKGVRADCWVSIKPNKSGLELDIKSKISAMYGKTIEKQVRDVLKTLGVDKAKVEIEDTGALPYVIAARIETAARRAGLTDKSALPEKLVEPKPSSAERFRRSRLYLPGNQPKLAINAGLHKPDGVILDLEDSVSPAEKDAARILVRNTLLSVDFMGAELMVRINQLPAGLDDLDWVVPFGAQLIVIPKCECAREIKAVEDKINSLKPKNPVYMMPIIESAAGCFNALQIASVSEKVVCMTIGLEDYTADLGVQRTDEGKESLWGRYTVVNASKAAGVQCSDSVFSDVSDMEALKASALKSKATGFDGMGCIHPRQISVIHEAFAPDADEIKKAVKIVKAFDEATAKGLGVVSLGSKMIDPPVVKRALKSVEQAEMLGRLPKKWKKMDTEELFQEIKV